jgi:hypothetical protein
MPSTSKQQHNFMEAVAHSPSFAKKAGVPMSVGKDFSSADKGRKFAKGGTMAKSDMKEDMKADKAQDVSMIKKAFKQHDSQEHKGGKGTTLKLAKGGTFRASANGIAQRGKTKGTQIAMCGGGMMKGKK